MSKRANVEFKTEGAELTLVGEGPHVYLRVGLRGDHEPPEVQPDYLGTLEGGQLRKLGQAICRRFGYDVVR